MPYPRRDGGFPSRVPVWARTGPAMALSAGETQGGQEPGRGTGPVPPPDADSGRLWLTADGVARIWRVSYDTVLGLIKVGRIGAVRIGRRWRIHRDMVTDWQTVRQRMLGDSDPPPRTDGRRRGR